MPPCTKSKTTGQGKFPYIRWFLYKYKNLYVSHDNLSFYFSLKRCRPYKRTAKPFPLAILRCKERTRLNQVDEQHGRLHPSVIRQSQKLDDLTNEYYKEQSGLNSLKRQ
ncbi:aspartyl-phosphate phosphatase Spo0E family protein [Paenibacillus sp. FSL R7-0297]|uniref:aspartyl-phosphate phosphatase Spo0E family protein n=1 Tax=Paenibacillus sp. FSL R7-0297 TaxID=2921680 RepID=UPI0030F61985